MNVGEVRRKLRAYGCDECAAGCEGLCASCCDAAAADDEHVFVFEVNH